MLEIKGLKAYYDEAEILRGVDINVGKGEAVAILGPNGAGKTTLLKAICGLVRCKGEITFDGRRINDLKTHERIRLGMAICPEGRRLFPNLTVEDNLLLAGDEELDTVYSLFPRLRERKKQLVKTMSGGEQQMVAIARALMRKPKLLMLDEPSTGLAPIVVEAIGSAISKIRDELRISILIVEQNIHLAFKVASRAYVLVKGEVVKEGRTSELRELEKEYFEM
ncbi:MAG: branched-chain amino acid ABC transporter ATP-binding protein [Archaeoglobales archaeon]|nr:MAG: branched-chain amino acid ABC transporter ATP-binding protein [Archaeoglobales archaeon]